MQDLKTYYQKLFKDNGPTPAAVQHVNKASQYERFDILTSIASDISSIVDVGCGLGDMFRFLLERDYKGKYLGVDFVSDFIQYARQAYQDYPKAEFKEIDIIENEIPKADYVLLSGVFNNKLKDNAGFMSKTIAKMFSACQKGMAFNAMSTYVDYQDEHLYYSNPMEIFDYCKRELTPFVVLKHDYLLKKNSVPFEYTMFLYKNAGSMR